MKGKSMHRKKFLSFLGMAAIAAPILAKEIPQADEVKPLELKEGSLGIGKLGMLSEASEPEAVGNGVTITNSSPFKGINVTPSNITITNGSILVWNGSELRWAEQPPIERYQVYHSKFIT